MGIPLVRDFVLLPFDRYLWSPSDGPCIVLGAGDPAVRRRDMDPVLSGVMGTALGASSSAMPGQ